MSHVTSAIRIGDARTFQGLTVFPIFGQNLRRNYLLLHEALARKELAISEVSAGGSVPELLAEVTGENYVLLFAGEVVTGGRQNRVINTTMLLRRRSSQRIPVSCVEHGRWSYKKADEFASSRSVVPPSVRSTLDRSVNETATAGHGFTSDQNGVWAEVASTLGEIGAHSETDALGAALEHAASSTDEYVAALPFAEGATGFCLAIGETPRILRVFTGSDVCEPMWKLEIAAAAIDAIRLERRSARGARATHANYSAPTVADVLQLYTDADRSDWQAVETIGSGRSEMTSWSTGSASRLSRNETMIHLAVTR